MSNFTHDGFPSSRKVAAAHQIVFGDDKEPNFDFIHPEWPRLPVLSKGARELFGGREPSFPFITRRWPSGCVSRRLYEISSLQGMTQEFLKYPIVHLDALREGSKEVHPMMPGTSMALVRFDDVDLLPHPFFDQETFVVNGLVSDGPWLSPAHSEVMEGRATPWCCKDWRCGWYWCP